MRKVAVFIVFAFLVGCCFISGVSNPIEQGSFDTNTSKRPSETPMSNPMGFQWAVRGHDAQNTCLSEYGASQNEGYEKWKYFADSGLDLVTPVIDGNGILYTTSTHCGLHAIYPNGTRKWHSDLVGDIEYQPAIGPDGTIYAGTIDRFHAFYPNGTLRWILPMEKNFCSNPIISPEGIVYVGTDDGYLYAVYPNGTIQWEYYLGYRLIAASLDSIGNIYFTARSCDYLYCLNPNGTCRWTFEIVQDTSDAPLIGKDGTIYTVPVYDVIAINPNGTEKWRTPTNGAGGSPSLSPDGTIIYSSHDSGNVIALDPDDGHIRWMYQLDFDPPEKTRPAISSDGTIFIAYTKGNTGAYLSALNSDGELRWTANITSDIYPYDVVSLGPTPSIGADGTVYVTTLYIGNEQNFGFGYVHAFGQLDPNAPSAPTIIGPPRGKVRQQHEYTFTSTSPIGKNLSYYVLWGDDTYTNWTGPFPSDESVSINHSWSKRGTYTIQARARDSDNLLGTWGNLEVTMPKNNEIFNVHPILSWLFEWFPNAFPILRYLLDQ